MVQRSHTLRPYRVPDTLLSDTEESVVGTQWHQDTFFQFAEMLRTVSDRRGATWGVCTQIALAGLLHDDGSNYDPMPDLMVLPQPLASPKLARVHFEEVGVPLFIAEVASDSTWQKDSGEKRRAYEAIGVPEYMAVDLTGDYLAERVRAWRLVGGVYRRWAPDSEGWWQSELLEVALRPGPLLMQVRDRDGLELAPITVLLPLLLAEEARRTEAEQRFLAEEARRVQAERRQQELEDLVQQLRAQSMLPEEPEVDQQ